MKTKRWRPLQKGDGVDLIAPGWACTKEELNSAVRFLEDLGLKPRWEKTIFKERLLFSHDHRERFRQLKAALISTESRAVWCLRGGYGSIHLLPSLSKLRPPKEPKLFIGISDITSLNIFLNQKWGWPTLHGPLLDRVGSGKLTKKHEKEMLQLCFGELMQMEFKGLKALNEEAEKERTLRAPVVGGNLTVIQSSLGTPYSIAPKSCFLFIEDLGERGYRVDRIFEQLRQAGLLKGVKAILVGDFLGGHERDGKSLIQAVLKDWAKELRIPFISGLPCGHADVQRPLPLGTSAILRCGSRPSLVVSSGAQA